MKVIWYYNFMSNYFQEKSKFYYDFYLQGKLVQKVSAIIKNGEKFLVLINKNNRAYNVGGSVDIGEKARQAIIREIKEETGGDVSKIKYITKTYYQVEWEYNGIKFPNKRVDYCYLVELKDNLVHIEGLNGEFSNNDRLEWHTIQELENLKVNKKDLDLYRKSLQLKL